MIMYKTVRKILEAISTSESFKQLGLGQGVMEAGGGTQPALCISVLRFLFTGQRMPWERQVFMSGKAAWPWGVVMEQKQVLCQALQMWSKIQSPYFYKIQVTSHNFIFRSVPGFPIAQRIKPPLPLWPSGPTLSNPDFCWDVLIHRPHSLSWGF